MHGALKTMIVYDFLYGEVLSLCIKVAQHINKHTKYDVMKVQTMSDIHGDVGCIEACEVHEMYGVYGLYEVCRGVYTVDFTTAMSLIYT